jgi:hypothetical protein
MQRRLACFRQGEIYIYSLFDEELTQPPMAVVTRNIQIVVVAERFEFSPLDRRNLMALTSP